MTSIIIPVLNESDQDLLRVIDNLTADQSPTELELLICNDGSINSDGSIRFYKYDETSWPNLTIYNRETRLGVGASFDYGVNRASGDIIVLCGSDIRVEGGKWLKSVLNTVKRGQVACGVSIGLQPGNLDIDAPNLYKRYGAKIIYKLGVEDLPKASPLRRDPDYRDILQCKWLSKQSDEPYEIPSVFGAFYWLYKEDYVRFGGFDTREDNPWSGFRYWGHLEPFLSLKAKVYGMHCTMFPDFRVGHIFARLGEDDRSFRLDYVHYNALWIAHTMFEDSFRDEIIAHMKPNLNWGLAQSYIRQNWDVVQETRKRNKENGKLISKQNGIQ